MKEYIAHVRVDNHCQSNEEHLIRTADLASQFAADFQCENWVTLLGLFLARPTWSFCGGSFILAFQESENTFALHLKEKNASGNFSVNDRWNFSFYSLMHPVIVVILHILPDSLIKFKTVVAGIHINIFLFNCTPETFS